MLRAAPRAASWLACCASVALLAGCSDGSLAIFVSPPPDTAWIATFLFDQNNLLLGASGLERWQAGAALRRTWDASSPDVARVTIVAFSEQSLAGFVLPGDEAMARSTLRMALSRDPVLPPATWSGTGAVVDGRVSVEAAATKLELTAGWLPPCPTLIPPGAVGAADVGCVLHFCDAEITQSECLLKSDLVNCSVSVTQFTLDGRGRGQSDACSIAAPLPEAVTAVDCGDCSVQIYVPPFPDRFVVDELPVFVVPPVTGPGLGPPTGGYLAGAARSGGRLAVVSRAGAPMGPVCSSTVATRLHFIDLATASEVARVDGPPCLYALTEDPLSDGFFGLTTGPSFSIIRFDEQGHQVQTSTTIHSITPAAYNFGAFAATADGGRVVASFSPFVGTNVAPHLVFDAHTLAFQRVIRSAGREPDNRIHAAVATTGSEVAFGTDPAALVRYYDLATGAESATVNVGTGRAVNKTSAYLSYAPARGAVLGSSPPNDNPLPEKDVPLLHVLSVDSGEIGAGSSWQLRAGPTATHVWAHGVDQVLASLVAPGTHETYAALFDGAHTRFLPGMTRVGTGPVTKIVEDSRHDLWLVMPWTAKLVRVSPR